MTTQHVFNAQAAVGLGHTGSSDDVTMVATVDDGTVSVGDSVTFTGLTSNVESTSGISNGSTAYYHGQGTFGGIPGYVFSTNPTMAATGPFLIVSDSEQIAGRIAAGDLNGFADDSSVQTLTPNAACFAVGTMIATARGEVAVEKLAIGDNVMLGDGSEVSIKWIGRQSISKLFGGAGAQIVRIAAGTIGNHSDLCVTADHGMIVDGLIINASALVNGGTIAFVPPAELDDKFTVFHIETENHDVILANGAAAETFVDAVGRTAFDNYQEYLDLYGVERIIPEMDLFRISSQRLLPNPISNRLGIFGDQSAIELHG